MNREEVEAFSAFLEERYENIIDLWVEQMAKEMSLTPDDPIFRQVVDNGWKTVRLVSAFVGHPDQQHIMRLTKKIAKERIASDTNLEVLVKNISIGRLIIFEEIISSDFSESFRTQLIFEVTRFFDLFLYYVTGAYNELKESIINDKNRFIQQMHSDRLTILGQIAASFAHEFRNPLTSIKGFMALIERRIKADQKTDYYFSIIKREMKGLEEKVTRFLFLSKMKGLDDREETIRLNDLLRETVEFLYPRFLSEGIEVIIDIEPVKMLVSGVTEQLKQVFLNILNNAVEELSQLPDLKKIFLSAKQKGDHIYIRIANNGQKIEDHLLDNIFEPFISTKELGTGLGLAVCKQIIEKHDGKITVTSTDEETAFHLELPNKKD